MNRTLMKALKNKFSMMKDDAKELTKIIEEIFEGEDEVNDAEVNRHVRQLFCELQREKIVKVRREEFREKGRLVRQYYWSLNKEVINKEAKKKNKNQKILSIYDKLPEEVWLKRSYCS